MSEVVERVARALFLADHPGHNPDAPDPEGSGRLAWREWEPNARAALEALREPTEGMVEAGMLRAGDTMDAGASTGYVASETYRAMIDAALK